MPAPSPVEARVRRSLADLRAQGLLRAMRPPAGVDLSSNDYLALSTHPRVTAAFVEAALRDGVGSTGSRLLRGDREAFADVERAFAAFKGTQRSLFFSSGYLANLAAVSTFCEADDVIFSDARNHASLIDGMRLARASRVVFPHNDIAALARLIESTPCGGSRFVIVESLFSMDGDEAPLAACAALCRETGALLIVDEAHAVGIRGERGTGLVEEAGVAADVFLTINPAGKALGVGGAFVAGPDWAIEHLVQRARPFIFSTAAPPAMAPALGESLALIREEPGRRERLHALAAHLRTQLRAHGADVASGISQIVPIHIGGNEPAVAIAAALQADGFDVRAIRPPSVAPGAARLRVSVNTGHDETMLDGFVERLMKAMQEAGLCSAVSS